MQFSQDVKTTYLALLKKAVTNDASSMPVTCDLPALLSLAHSHNSLLLIAQFIDQTSLSDDWKKVISTEFAASLFMEEESEHLLQKLADANIDHIPVKGYQIKKLYPNPSLRQMGDIDILVPKNQFDQLDSIIEANDYQKENDWNAHYHKAYSFPPFFEVEFHHALSKDDAFHAVWDHALADQNAPHRYTLSPEDTLIYHIHHGLKHFLEGGIGSRYLCDLWLIQKHIPSLDYEKVIAAITSFDAPGFTLASLKLCEKCFGKYDKLTDFITKLSVHTTFDDALIDAFCDQILESGAFGSVASRFENEMLLQNDKETSQNLFLFFLKKLFPDKATLTALYPELAIKPYLLPVYRIKRILDTIFSKKSRNALRAVGQMNATDDTSIHRKRELFKALHLTK